MITAIATILAMWVGCWILAFGWGRLACRLARCQRGDNIDLMFSPWIGIACIVALLQIWHFYAPIDSWAVAAVSVVGVVSFVVLGRDQAPRLPAIIRGSTLSAAVVCVMIVWLANRSLNTQEYTDNGLYYMNAIRWNTDFRVVPGLANLHNRLGFNNSNFLLHALLEVDGWRGYSGHLVNGFFAALCVPLIVQGFRSIIDDTGDSRRIGWFTLTLVMIVAIAAADRRISSAHGDFAAAVFITIAAWRLLVIQGIRSESKGAHLRYNLLTIALLATTAVTFKTTVIFFAGLAGVALAITLFRLESRRSPTPMRAMLVSLAFILPWCALLFIPWIGRGYLLSGYPLFPATIAGASVDWIYPPDSAKELREAIYAWARTYHSNRHLASEPGWGWVRPWILQVAILRAPVEVAIPAAICLLSSALLLLSKFARKVNGDTSTHDSADSEFDGAWLLAFAYAVSVAMWFLTSPSPRMGSFALWGLAATLLILTDRTFVGTIFSRHRRLVLLGVIGLAVLPMVDESVRIETRYRKNPNLPEFGKRFYHFYPFVIPTWTGRYPPKPQARLVKKLSNRGVEVYLGEMGPNGIPELVWDSPLPAAQFLNPELESRESGDMQAGFRTAKPMSNTYEANHGS